MDKELPTLASPLCHSRNGKADTLIIIPAFNEEMNITRVIGGIRKNIPDADILVVDDGSRDATAYLARRAGANVVSHPFNMGYGVTCQTGFKCACRHGYQFAVLMDGDGQHEPSCIPDLLNALNQPDTDIVLGSRWLGVVQYQGPWLRKFGKRFFAFLANLITRTKISDPTTGFQAMNRKVIKFFTTDIYPVDYPDADVIIMLNRAGFNVKEAPVIMYKNQTGQSMHSGILKPMYYGLKMILSITMTLLRNDRNLRQQFSPSAVQPTFSEMADAGVGEGT